MAMFAPKHLEFGSELASRRINIGDVIFQKAVVIARRAQVIEACNVCYFDRSERAIEDAKIVQLAVLKTGIAETIADGELGLAGFVGDIFPKMIADYVDFRGFAVDEDMKAGSVAR